MEILLGLLGVLSFLTLGWGLCAFFTAVVAAIKGRTIIGWLLLGIFFGIFALIVVCLLPPRRANQAKNEPAAFFGRRGIQVEKKIQCKNCGNSNPRAHRFCGRCGLAILSFAKK